MTSRTCACTVTSSAVVGSSAMSRAGFSAIAIAIIDALAHAAGELVRVVVHPAAGMRDADQAEQLDRPVPGPPTGIDVSCARIISTICQPTR